MASGRSLLDRLTRRAVPRPLAGYAPEPRELSAGLWALDRQLCHLGGARLPARTTIIRLKDGKLVVVSPPPLVDARAAAAIDAIGAVTQVIAPNTFHYIYAAEFMARYSNASLLVAPGLIDRVADLPRAEELGANPPAVWSGELEYTILGPVRGVSEVLLFHVPTATLILTDLAFNMVRFPRSLDRIAWRLLGIPKGFGPGRTSRWLLLTDHEAASRALRRVLEWPVRQIVLAHGDVVEHDAMTQFRRAFERYLRPAHLG